MLNNYKNNEKIKPEVEKKNEKKEEESLENILLNEIPKEKLEFIWKILYGKKLNKIDISEESKKLANQSDFEILGEKMEAEKEEMRNPRVSRIGIIQHKIVLSTLKPLQEQREAIFKKVGHMIDLAGKESTNILCLQECWSSPFFMCTREKLPFCELAEDPETGPSTIFLSEYAKRYKMIIISPILERDYGNGDQIFNTAVIISNNGKVLGKTRKNHIPRVGDFNESTYYMEGNLGHPVFNTCYGKIAVNICYGRHHPLNWLAFSLKGAELIFNPCATTSGLSEHLWFIEARNAAISNSCFTFAINRVGSETFKNEFTSGDGFPAHRTFGHFYGSSYATGPDGSRTMGLSRKRDALLLVDCDLNLCRQIKDKWGFKMTQRLDLYAPLITKASNPHFQIE